MAIAYADFGIFLALVVLFARPGVASALIRGPDIVAQLIFTQLIAAWSIWIGIGISTRANDVRVAQQLSVLASLPMLVVTTLIAFDVIRASLGLGLALGVALLLLNRLGWRLVSALFDRERLIAGTDRLDGILLSLRGQGAGASGPTLPPWNGTSSRRSSPHWCWLRSSSG
ncbi:MAG TPA: hypothetical protein VI110_07435 [Lapillicoccus sp.]